MSETILKIEALTKRFAGLTAVSALDIDVRERTIHSLIGPNGSGKSTTINMINSNFPPTSGKIIYKGENITGLSTFEIARRGIGRTYQNLKVFSSMSVLENMMADRDSFAKQNILSFLLDPRTAYKEEKAIREKAEEVLQYIGMYELRDTLAKNLPYGRQKLVELGRALMIEPKLLLLNSPASMVIIQLQDYLGLGSESRMNTPSTMSGNWRWRVGEDSLSCALAHELRELILSSGR